ncbi:hypothetical protein VV02_05365 [Luteipulveratus mongoliensis]|uniref:Lipase n=1 Tax=Luteipulveratus mongoliensis TaxID=571913 RepID=A0A0K1JPM2_9MICO|nr:hypothetical protein VV02_05365 [Luteipulveratus mongoliensis]
MSAQSASAQTTESAAAAQNPVIFVHGYGGAADDVSAIKQSFLDAGYSADQIHSLDFPNEQVNETTAQQLSTTVNSVLTQSGASKVDVIGFSMGSLSSRYYLKNLGGTAKVEHFASIAGANHGTASANWCWIITSDKACPQMAPGSTFLKNLNADDETPGTTTQYATWASHSDGTISPPESIQLEGAANHWTAEDTDHVGTLTNPAVQRDVIAFFGAAG